MDERERQLGAIAAYVEQRQAIDAATDERILTARAAGATWDQLGAALGITRQAAKLRHERAEQHRREPRK